MRTNQKNDANKALKKGKLILKKSGKVRKIKYLRIIN